MSQLRLKNIGDAPQHLPERPHGATTNNRCVVCSARYNKAKQRTPTAKDSELPKRSKTVFRCTTCKVFLCIGAGAENCFMTYHSVAQYYR